MFRNRGLTSPGKVLTLGFTARRGTDATLPADRVSEHTGYASVRHLTAEQQQQLILRLGYFFAGYDTFQITPVPSSEISRLPSLV